MRLFIKEQIRLFFVYSYYYNILYAFAHFLWWFCFYMKPPFSYKLSKWCIKIKTNYWDKRLQKKYADVISAIDKGEAGVQSSNYRRVWVFWAQGETEMPPLIQACYRQLRHYHQNITLVSMLNLKEYIDLDDEIYDKLHKGKIGWANFSDIVRNTLLAQYGGLWLDATVWISKEIPFDELAENPYWTAAFSTIPSNKQQFYWSNIKWNWSSSIMFARDINFPLFTFVSQMLVAIAKREKEWPDYVILDYLIYTAYRKYPIISGSMQHCKNFADNRLVLAESMNKPYSEEAYKQIIGNEFCFKLSYRTAWNKTTQGGTPTFNGRMLNDII